MTKEEARQELRKARANVQDRAEKERAMAKALLAFPPMKRVKCVLLYNAIGTEPDLSPLLHALREKGVRICLPRVEGREMAAVPISEDTVFCKGAFGILEPQGEAIDPKEIDLVVCPGLGFTPDGSRLGYGGGFYDRFLKKKSALRVGLCYNACIRNFLPTEESDERMDALVTECGLVTLGKERCK